MTETRRVERFEQPDLEHPDEWGWVGELSSQALLSAGEISLELLLRGYEWVNRRVETIDLIDESRVRQSVSVDFRLPEKLPGSFDIAGKRYYALPLLMMPRRSDLACFDVRDESGRTLPMLTRKENARLSGLMLLTAAKRAVGEKRGERILSDSLRTYLAGLPLRSPHRALPMVEEIVKADELLFDDPAVAKKLLADEDFLDLLGLCRYCSAIHIPLLVEPGERRIVKIAWEGRWGTKEAPESSGARERARRRWHRLQGRAGWRPESRILDTPQIGGSESHHIQIAVPAGVELTEAGCLNGPPRVMLPNETEVPDPRDDPFQPFSSSISPRAHLYIPRSHETRAGLLQVGLRTARHGLLPAAILTGALLTILLTLYSLRADQIVGQSETGAALLLLVPAVLAGMLVRPGEHAMARVLLRGPRLMTTILGVLPLVAAAGLVSAPSEGKRGFLDALLGVGASDAPDVLRWVWGLLAFFSLVLTGCLWASYKLPRSGKRDSHGGGLEPAPTGPPESERPSE